MGRSRRPIDLYGVRERVRMNSSPWLVFHCSWAASTLSDAQWADGALLASL